MRSPALALPITALLGACASPPQGFKSPEPAARLAAITKAAETRDPSTIPRLIEMLESDDPVVRLASIRTLELLTGQTLGYDYADPPWLRQDHVREWVDWYTHQATGAAPQKVPGTGEGSPQPRQEPIKGGEQ